MVKSHHDAKGEEAISVLMMGDWMIPYDQGHAQMSFKGGVCPSDRLGILKAQGSPPPV